MTPRFERVQQLLKQLPGLGYRSAERIALHLLVEQPAQLTPILEALQEAQARIQRCPICGHLTEEPTCAICADPRRDPSLLCLVETVPDLLAMERAGAYRGHYHVLHGKLSPLHDVGPDDLNLAALGERLDQPERAEVILALSNDLEGEATCHYLRETFLAPRPHLRVSRIGFGLPSGGQLTYADQTTLQSALQSRRAFE